MQQGDALFFHSITPHGHFDVNAYHAGCEVHSGLKWGATIWIHTDPFKRKLQLQGNIISTCEAWECYMLYNFTLQGC